MVAEILQRFLTDEQYARILVDRALFDDSYNVRTRSVRQLALEYGPKAKRIIEEIIDSTPATDYTFRAFCRNVIDGTIDRHDEKSIE